MKGRWRFQANIWQLLCLAWRDQRWLKQILWGPKVNHILNYMWHVVVLPGLAETYWGHEITTNPFEGRGNCLIDLLVSDENVTKLNERSFHVCEYPIAEANSCTWIKSLIYRFMSETERVRVPCSTSNYREWERFWGTFVLCRRCYGYLSIQSSFSSCLLPLLQVT